MTTDRPLDGDGADDPVAELERLRALVGPNEMSYLDLQSDVAAAREVARRAELEAGELRGRLAQLDADMHRARQDQHQVVRFVFAPVVAVRRTWRSLRRWPVAGRTPRFSVLTAVHDPDPEHLEACLRSVRRQELRNWEHVIVDDASTDPRVGEILSRAAEDDRRIRLVTRRSQGGIVAASGDALAAATGTRIALLDHDDELTQDALWEMDRALRHAPVAYSDHDMIYPDGRYGAMYYKPDFSPEQLRSQNYVLHLVAADRALVRQVGGFRAGFDGAQDHDLLLRLAEVTEFAHVPKVLYHWRQAPGSVASDSGSKPWAYDSGRRAVADHCQRAGIAAEVEPGPLPGTYRIRRRLAHRPRISVVIPTRGSSGRVHGVTHCFVTEAVRSLVDRSTYPDVEYVVVHDDVTPPPVIAELQRLAGDALRLVPYASPFNFSEKVNVGVAASTGELILLLNDDTELIEPDSLEVMASHLADESVGMVGAKLLFGDDTVQDAGHVYSGHLLPGLQGWSGNGTGPWQLRPLIVEREVAGVTAAAAMVRRETFEELGGFDESIPVSFNDVDFSLRLRATGRRIVWTPWASWHHFESQTRPPEASDEEFERMDRQWHAEINGDPYYNPNLARYRADWVERPFHSGDPEDPPEPFWPYLKRKLRTGVFARVP